MSAEKITDTCIGDILERELHGNYTANNFRETFLDHNLL